MKQPVAEDCELNDYATGIHVSIKKGMNICA